MVDIKNTGSQAPSQSYSIRPSGVWPGIGGVTCSQGILVSGQVWGLLLRTQPPAIGGALRGTRSPPGSGASHTLGEPAVHRGA